MKIEANGIEIEYVVSGKGPWLTMSHSLTCNLSMWAPQLRWLEERFTVLRYDTRGHGGSSAPEGAYTLEQLADDALGLLDALGVQRTHWVGLSMGGMVGQVFALAHPERVASLALCDTAARYPAGVMSVWEERIAIARTKGMEALVEPTLARWFNQGFREAPQNAALMADVATMIRTTPVAGYVGCCHAVPRIDVLDRLGEIRCPATVIVGADDKGTPVAMAQDIQRALPGSSLVVIPDAGHISNLEQPAAFDAALTGFYDGIEV